MENTLGIILAGGYGKRLLPLTKVINKHLLPVYDKPLIYYSLSILLKAKVKEIIFITNPEHEKMFKTQLNFLKGKVKIKFCIQKKPGGIAQGLLMTKKIIKNKDVLLVLGDNIIKSEKIYKDIKKNYLKKSIIFTKKVKDPNRFGVIKYKDNKIIKIIEKPKRYVSNDAVTGIYFYKNKDLDHLKYLKKSKRGELEITDLNNYIIQDNNMLISKLTSKDYWLDTGTFESLFKAGEFFFKNKSNEFDI
tara:strand:+ start:553 stop:1293 length:741 start_codon:yes stop_codon:yes gene_type:complete